MLPCSIYLCSNFHYFLCSANSLVYFVLLGLANQGYLLTAPNNSQPQGQSPHDQVVGQISNYRLAWTCYQGTPRIQLHLNLSCPQALMPAHQQADLASHRPLLNSAREHCPWAWSPTHHHQALPLCTSLTPVQVWVTGPYVHGHPRASTTQQI